MENIKKIYDYEILRKTINNVIENRKTREGAITTVRRLLYRYEEKNKIIILNTFQYLKNIEREVIKWKVL